MRTSQFKLVTCIYVIPMNTYIWRPSLQREDRISLDFRTAIFDYLLAAAKC